MTNGVSHRKTKMLETRQQNIKFYYKFNLNNKKIYIKNQSTCSHQEIFKNQLLKMESLAVRTSLKKTTLGVNVYCQFI